MSEGFHVLVDGKLIDDVLVDCVRTVVLAAVLGDLRIADVLGHVLQTVSF